MSNVLSKDQIIELISGTRHCSQIVAGQWAEDVGIDKEQMVRMMAPFGGGGFHGEMCGAAAGALAVIGAEYGHFDLGDTEQNEEMIARTSEFLSKFEERFGTVLCRELLEDYDLDFSREGDLERAMGTTVFFDVCPDFIQGALEILEEVME